MDLTIIGGVIIFCVLYSYFLMILDHIRDSFLMKMTENRRVVNENSGKKAGFSPIFW